MAIILALPALVDAVTARFEAELDAPPAQSFGWREPARQPRSHRIVWVPGDDEGDALGEVSAAKYPGRNPRPLATVHELATVYLEAVDTSARENERAQYVAARLLFDAWLRAVYLAAHGTYRIESVRWVTGAKERRYGAAIRVLLSIEAMVPDEAHELVPADAHAEIDVEELDVSETMTTASP